MSNNISFSSDVKESDYLTKASLALVIFTRK